MNSMRLRPPRPPGERASRESQTTEMLCTAEKVSVFAAGRLTVRALTCPRCAACTESSPLLPHAVVVSLLTAGVKGASPCSSFFFPFFFLRRKKKRVGTDAVAKSLSEKQNPTSTQLPTNQHHHNHPIGGKNEYRNNRTSQRDQFRL